MTIQNSVDPIYPQFLNIGETLQSLQPKTWNVTRTKLQASLAQCSSFPTNKISFLVENVVTSIRNQSKDIRQDIYNDLGASNILSVSLLKTLSNNLSSNEILMLKMEMIKDVYFRDNKSFYNIINECQIDSNSAEGLTALIEIAKFSIKSNSETAIKHIKNFNINPNTNEGQAALIELAKFSAEIDCAETSLYIKEFQIKNITPKDQLVLIEIAKLAAKHEGYYPFSQFVKNYEINSETPEGKLALIEIAKIAAHTDKSEVAKYIQNYGINHDTPEGQLALIEIAKITAEQKNFLLCSSISKYIQNFRIDYTTNIGQLALIEIAKIAAQADASGVSQFIQNYGINPKTKEGNFALIEIAKIVARQNGREISLYIQNYGIDHKTIAGQIALIEIAKIAAHKDGFGVTCYIQNYKINSEPEGQIALIEIAKIAAAHPIDGISGSIKNYRINDETPEGQIALIEIARIVAKQHGFQLATHIQNYCINHKTPEGQIALIEIAKIAIRQPQTSLLDWNGSNVNNFKIDSTTFEGRSVLIEIFRLDAKFSNFITIKKFPRNLVEVNSLEWIQVYSFAGFLYLGSLSFNGNEEDQNKVNEASNNLRLAFSEFNTSVGNFKLVMNLFVELNNEKLLELCENAWDQRLKPESSYYKKKNQEISITPQIASLLTQLEFTKPPRMDLMEYHKIQRSSSMWLKSILGILSLLNISSEDMSNCLLPIITALLELKDPKLREILTNKLIFDFLNQEHNQSKLERNQLQSNVITFRQQKPKNIGVLLCFVLTLLQQQGVQLPELLPYITSLKGGSSTLVLKDAHFVKQLLSLLNQLYEQKELQSQDKEKLLQIIFVCKDIILLPNQRKLEKERILNLIGIIKGIIYLGAVDVFRTGHFLTQKDLENILFETFSKIIPIKSGIEDFALKLVNLFNQFRDFKLIQIYGARLQGGEELLTLKTLAECLESIIQLKYPKCRYEGSLHLTKIFEQRPDLEVLWQKSEEKDFLSLIKDFPIDSPSTSLGKPEYRKFIINSFAQGRLESKYYPFLFEFLNEKNLLKHNDIIQKLKLAIKNFEFKLKADLKDLELQLLLISLIDDNNMRNPINILNNIVEKIPQFTNKIYQIQFENVIKALVNIVSIKDYKLINPMIYNNWKIVNTDNFVDLFSCTTEVEGYTCQNINQEPHYNKCLMSYVVDGKNRLIAVKDDKGKIRARAIIRILLDSISNKPVLFLEMVYPVLLPPEILHVMITMAKIQSLTLGLPLLNLYFTQGIPYKSPIVSISSSAPFEYVDANRNGITNGIYTINDTFIIA